MTSNSTLDPLRDPEYHEGSTVFSKSTLKYIEFWKEHATEQRWEKMRAATSRELASMIIDLQTAGFTNDRVQQLLRHLQGISVLDSPSLLRSQNLLDHLQANPNPISSSTRTNQLTLKLKENLSVESDDPKMADKNRIVASDLRHSVSLDLVELAQEAYSTCRLPASRSLISSFQYLSAEQFRKTDCGKHFVSYKTQRVSKKRDRDSRKERFEQQTNKRRKFQNDFKSRIVIVIFIRTSPDTDNDGLRQLVAIMMAVRQLQHAGFNIELYPIVCYAKDSSRHKPFECKAFHQVLQILCAKRSPNRDSSNQSIQVLSQSRRQEKNGELR